MIKKIKKIDHNYLFIILFCLALLYIVVPENCIFGSKIDWVSQHIVFPDYFRKLFYSTHNLFPNFALSIGAGQNIYNFSYYGLLNPLIMFSYLLPIVPMTSYIIVMNAFLYIFFGIVLYSFLKSKFDQKVSFLTTLIILCASSILFHFHKHFMFVDYLPFLILGLIATDKYFENHNRVFVSICVFLLILTSYYYSILSIAVMCIYALYLYLQKTQKLIIKDMILEAISYLFPVFIGILMSGILLLPTAYVLFTGRVEHSNMIEFLPYFLPKYNLDGILYGNYSLGLTVISLLSYLFLLFTHKKEDKYLFWILTMLIFIPIFIFLLNGKLYLRNKVLIPLIPLFAYSLAKFLSLIFSKKIPYLYFIVISFILIVSSIFLSYVNPLFYLEFLILLLIIYIYYKGYTNKIMLSLVLLLVPLFVLLYSNNADQYVEGKLNYHSTDEKEIEINHILDREDDLVRFNDLEDTLTNVNKVFIAKYNHDSLYSSLSNILYQNFYKKVFHHALSYRNNLVLAQNNDILFQMFMGVKYIYSKDKVPVGYHQVDQHIYQNDHVLPLFYGTSSLTNEKIFDRLKYPYNIGTLLNSAVVSSSSTKDVTNTIREVELNYDILSKQNLTITKKDKYQEVISKKEGNLKLGIHDLEGDILIIRIKLLNTPNCSSGDVKISINGISNVLTCKQWLYKNNNKTFDYVISSNKNMNTLDITFDDNVYKIQEIKTYTLNYDHILNINQELAQFDILDNHLDNGYISGVMKMKDDGYFVSSIPYDKGFSAYVDGKKIKTEVVNKAFLGFPLKKGKHKIKIEYSSPLFKQGMIFSILGFVLFISLLVIQKKKR